MKKLLLFLLALPIISMAQTGTPRSISYLEGRFQTGDKPTQADFYDIFASFLHYTEASGYQPLDGDLTSIAGLSAFGLVVRTSANTMTTRAITAGGGITISNGDGVSGNIAVSTMLTPVRLGFGSSSGTLTGSAKLKYYDSPVTIVAGNSISFSDTTNNTTTIVVGEGLTFNARLQWSAIFADVCTLSAALNNSIMVGSGNNTSGGQIIGGSSLLGNTITVQGAGTKGGCFFAGRQQTVDLSTGTSNGIFMGGNGCDITGTGPFIGTTIFGNSGSALANGAFVFANGVSTRKVRAAGIGSINMSSNNSSQQVNGGVNSNYSGIFAGLNSHIPANSEGSVIIGGSGIKADSAVTNNVYVPTLNIETEPTQNDTIKQILVREYSTGRVHYRDADALASSGTYTPVPTGIQNVEDASTSTCQYIRVGSVVHVSGRVDIDPTSTGTTQLAIDLPIASDFANDYECAGAGNMNLSSTGQGVTIVGDDVNDRVLIEYTAAITTAETIFFTFTYLIL